MKLGMSPETELENAAFVYASLAETFADKGDELRAVYYLGKYFGTVAALGDDHEWTLHRCFDLMVERSNKVWDKYNHKL